MKLLTQLRQQQNKQITTLIQHHFKQIESSFGFFFLFSFVLFLVFSIYFSSIYFRKESLTLAYMYTSQVYPANDAFCSLWNWFHYSVNLFLMGFASIERNWFIFHPKITNSKRGKYLFHYCPLVF